MKENTGGLKDIYEMSQTDVGEVLFLKQQTIQNYVAYQDGVFNPIPLPSTLDINDPEGADPNYKLKFTSIEGSKYEDSSFK